VFEMCKARSVRSLLSAAIAVRVSNWVLSAALLISAPVVKSVVRSIVVNRTIVTVEPPAAPRTC